MLNLQRKLLAAADTLGVSLDQTLAQELLDYVELLTKWNARINLTGTRNRDELVARHIVDALAVLPHIPPETRRLIDVGSGAGIPGAILAMARPELHVTALEPIHKKHAFLATARRELNITNFTPVAQRDESFRQLPDFSPFDVAISRATWSLDQWLPRGALLIHPTGLVLGMEGADPTTLDSQTTRHPYTSENRTRAIIVRHPN